jgi:VWFA-related protein
MRASAAANAVLLLASAVAPVPAPAQQVVPGVRAEIVQLDAVVVDAQGAVVRDLAREDFQILEDGRPQSVAQFFAVTRARPAAVKTPAPSDPGVVVEAPSVTTPPAAETAASGRQVVILVDDLHIGLQSMVEAKRALRRFVDEVALPDDAIAVVTTSGAGAIQQLTRDRAVVGQALERLITREPSTATNRSARLTPEQAALVLKGDRSALQLAVETVMTEPGTLLDANSPQAAVEGGGGGPGAQGAAAAAAGGAGATRDAVEKVAQREVERQAVQLLSEALRYSLATLNTLEDVVRSFARMPGRKLCLVVSDGFLDGAGSRDSRSLDLRRVLDAATRSGTVVYALDSRGLLTGADASTAAVGASPGVQARVERAAEQIKRDTLTTLADGTGGFLVRGTNDPLGGLRRMLDDNEAYYLLAYEPTNTKRDGRFRKIEVRLPNRPGLKVRTRSGYYAPDASKPAPPTRVAAPAPAAPSLAVAPAEARALLSAPIDAGGIPVALRADYVDLPPTGSQVLVRAQVDLAKMRWQEAEGRHRADVELIGGVFDSAGQPVGAPFGRRADLALDPPEYERARTVGFAYQQWLALPPGRYEVRLVARERGLVQQGGASQPVEVPDLKEKKLALSGVFLSTASPGSEVTTETVSHRFKRGASLSFQFYAYNPALGADGRSDVVLQAQVWSGGKAVAASPVQPVRLQQKDGVPVPETNVMALEGLGAGAYELRVVVQDRKANATTFRKVAFTIE